MHLPNAHRPALVADQDSHRFQRPVVVAHHTRRSAVTAVAPLPPMRRLELASARAALRAGRCGTELPASRSLPVSAGRFAVSLHFLAPIPSRRGRKVPWDDRDRAANRRTPLNLRTNRLHAAVNRRRVSRPTLGLWGLLGPKCPRP
jgi:hypothetical protein